MKKSHQVAHKKSEAWWVLLILLYCFQCYCQDFFCKKSAIPHCSLNTAVTDKKYFYHCCLITSDNNDNSLSTWIGFAICQFIPAAIASLLSSSNAFAVIAIIGMHDLSLSGKFLIACVAL